MRILFVGDIVGKPGRDLTRRAVPLLVRRRGIDLVVANVENAAGGFGVTRETGDAILAAGVHVMTSGNHIWDKKEALEYNAAESRLLRPLNYPAAAPGRGTWTASIEGVGVAVVNAMGRVHMPLVDDPFATLAGEVTRVRTLASIVIVDFHAEATSEKVAMGWHLDGRVTAVVGTHTHIPTADARLLEKGTAYQLAFREAPGLRDEFRTDRYLGAIQERETGILNPCKHVRALKRLAMAAGASVYEGSPVTRLERAGGAVRVHTPGGEVSAGRVVLATNAYTSALEGLPKLRSRQVPMWTYQVVTRR